MGERQPQILDIEKVIRDRAGKKAKYIPRFVINWFKKFMHLDFINGYLKEGYMGIEFCENCLKYLKVNIEVEGMENLPKDGKRYTFASNHPLGAIDGVTMGMILGKEYDGKIKYLMNDLLMSLKGMAPLGIPVNKVGGQSRNLPKLIDEVFMSDNQMLIFPSGKCSRIIDGKIQDPPWGKAFITKSIKSERDVVPIHFIGRNSDRFYKIDKWTKRLGIKLNLPMLTLPNEMYRSQGSTYRIIIGKPISYKTFDKSKTHAEWAEVIRQKVYEL